MFKTILAVLAVSVSLAACGPEKVSNDQLENARATVKSNVGFNAQLYRAANPRFTAEYSIIDRSDTSQTAECPQGDGWAQVSGMKVDGKAVDKTSLMCSTYSASVGCFRQEDFDKDKQLAGQDGPCNKAIPYPIPALKK